MSRGFLWHHWGIPSLILPQQYLALVPIAIFIYLINLPLLLKTFCFIHVSLIPVSKLTSGVFFSSSKGYLCNSLPQTTTWPIVHCVSKICIIPRSVALILVKAPEVLSKKKLHHLVGSDSVLEGFILLDISHRVNHKHHNNLLIPVLYTTMEKVSMRNIQSGTTKTVKHRWLWDTQNFIVKIGFLYQNF